MNELHVAAAWAAVVSAAALIVSAAAAAVLDGGHEAVRRLAGMVLAVFVFQGGTGLALLVTGASPSEALHMLYGLGLVAVIPLAAAFASEAPQRARSAVIGVGALTALLLGWRLFATG